MCSWASTARGAGGAEMKETTPGFPCLTEEVDLGTLRPREAV